MLAQLALCVYWGNPGFILRETLTVASPEGFAESARSGLDYGVMRRRCRPEIFGASDTGRRTFICADALNNPGRAGIRPPRRNGTESRVKRPI